MIIDDKFTRNQGWGNLQLTDAAFVELWQTSGSINQVEERYQELIEEYKDAHHIPADEFNKELKRCKHLMVETEDLIAIEKYGKSAWKPTPEYRALTEEQVKLRAAGIDAQNFVARYGSDDGLSRYRNRHSFAGAHRASYLAKRLTKNGVELRPLKRVSEKVYYYSQLNELAQSFR